MNLDVSSPEMAFALDAVRAASALSLQVQSGMAIMAMTKLDLSPVTVADFACQAVVSRRLQDALPGAVLVGEEDSQELRSHAGAEILETVVDFVGKVADGATRDEVCDWIDYGNGEPGDRFWTLDPIDGTKGYQRGGQFAIALSLIENGEVRLGVLGCPNLGPACTLEPARGGVIVAAARGQGCGWTPLHDSGSFARLRVSEVSDIRQARLMRSYEVSHTNTGQIDELTQMLGLEADPVSLDSQAKYAILGSGGGELLLRLLSPSKPDYKERIWDQAAGSIVVEEAGGRVSDIEGNALDFSQGVTLAKNKGVCASNGILHDAALEALARLPA